MLKLHGIIIFEAHNLEDLNSAETGQRIVAELFKMYPIFENSN